MGFACSNRKSIEILARALPERLARTSENLAKRKRKASHNQSASEPCQENSKFSFRDATWHRFWWPRRAPGRSRAIFLPSRGALGDPPGTPEVHWGHPETLPRRSRDAFGTLWGATIRAERVQKPIFGRFWVAGGLSVDRFSINVYDDFQSILQASWPVNGITHYGDAHRRTHTAKQKARQRESDWHCRFDRPCST